MKFALVTGGSRGIGRSVALELSQRGYYVIINYVRDNENANKTLNLIKDNGGCGEILKFDVSNFQETKSAIDKWISEHPNDYIEVLINNAGIRRDNLLLWMGQDDFESVIKTNLFSFYNVTHLLLQPMSVHKYGRIVNIASYSGIRGIPGQCNYSASKGGIIAATKALAQEMGKRNITVNAIAPGYITTDMIEGLDEQELKKNIPLNRFGTPEEVASLVGFLVSPQANYITGECISINGGLG